MKDHLSQLGHLAFITDSGQRVHGRVATVEKILTALAAKMNKKFQESDVLPVFNCTVTSILEHRNRA